MRFWVGNRRPKNWRSWRSPTLPSDEAPQRPLLIRLLRGLGYGFAAVVVVVEDWVWEAVGVLVRLVGRLALIRRFEEMLAAAPPSLALIAFVIPLILVEPAKLLAFALIAQGQFLPGVGLLILAYGLGTVLLVRVWNACKPALMTYRLIAWWVDTLARFRAAIHAWLDSIPAWRRLTALRAAIKDWAREVVRRFYRK